MWTIVVWKVVDARNLHWKPKFISVVVTKRVQGKEFGVNGGSVIISWRITHQNMIWNYVFNTIQNIMKNTHIYIQLTYNIKFCIIFKSNAHIHICKTC
jgi:hypothetical protein